MSQGANQGTGKRSLDQLRAANALECVKRLAIDKKTLENQDNFLASYRSYVERMPATIVMNGLGQALAMEQAAAGPRPDKPDQCAHSTLYQNVSRWLCRPDGGVYPGEDDVLEAMMKAPQSQYVQAQAESLSWLEWHKKFCQAHLPRREEE